MLAEWNIKGFMSITREVAMASHLTQGQLIIQNENLGIHHKKPVVDGKSKNSKMTTKKGGGGLGSRKALNDITNKSTLHQEASLRKKNLPKEEFNFAEEMFLHDHKKCIEAQKNNMKPCFLDTVLPGHDSVSCAECPKTEFAKTDPDSPQCYPEPVELHMTEFSDGLESSRQWNSPPSSPIHCWDSPPSSLFAWQLEPVEFVLRQENDF